MYINFEGILEKRVALVDIKSSPIHFYVQRKSAFDLPNKVIPFEIEVLNEGRAMNLATGVFRAPVNGVYYFSFRWFTSSSSARILMLQYTPVISYLRVNGIVKATSTTVIAGVTVSLECTLRLKKGDQVDVKKGPKGIFDDNNIEHLTHFSGTLLEEDLSTLF